MAALSTSVPCVPALPPLDCDAASSCAASSCGGSCGRRGASIVARRRAQAWEARRHRRIGTRVDEMLKHSSISKCQNASSSRSLKAGVAENASVQNRWCVCVTSCGHQCFYAHCRDPAEHGPCLTCTKRESDSCPICLDDLKAQPVLQTECGHIFHAQCLRSRVEIGARHNCTGDRLLFDFMECPLCKRPGIERLPAIKTLPPLNRQLELKNMVSKQKASLGDGNFIFQVCQKCFVPYCSGAEECHAQVQGPVEAICPPCNDHQPAGRPVRCPEHGTEHIAWKCRFCCSVASFECFSGKQQLHVCETCHELVELNTLFDFDTMENLLPLEQYGTCPVRRSVFRGGGRWARCHKDEGKPLDASQMKAIEHRLAVVGEQLRKCELEMAELEQVRKHDQVARPVRAGGDSAQHRLKCKAHSLRVEKDELEFRARAWLGSEAHVCPFKGMHPPTGIEYCLGCTICNEI